LQGLLGNVVDENCKGGVREERGMLLIFRKVSPSKAFIIPELPLATLMHLGVAPSEPIKFIFNYQLNKVFFNKERRVVNLIK
jgi:hypothetical protein